MLNQTIRIHPASDWFMRGVTSAVVVKIGSRGRRKGMLWVTDTLGRASFWLHPDNAI